MAFYVLMGR